MSVKCGRTLICAGAAILAATILVAPVQSQTVLPDNLGRGLTRLVQLDRANPAATRTSLKPFLTDRSGIRPLVNVRLDGKVSLDRLVTGLKRSGMEVTAVTRFDRGVIEGYLELGKVARVAQLPGVQSVLAVHRPVTNIGATTSQAVRVQQADDAQALGFDGSGIKIGVLSDSYASVTASPNAADDVATGDLPSDVVVLSDLAEGAGSDEGRAMLQLIYDVAPGSTLGFATAFSGLVDFANNIVALHDPAQFGAQITVDDIIYFSEPIFSDGIIAQAVDQVAAGGGAHFSSAGNQADQAYEATYSPVPVSDALKLVSSGQQNLSLIRALSTLRAVSFHDFDPGSGVDISQRFTVLPGGSTTITFQWDEPFGQGLVATDYNLLVFTADGFYLGVLSGLDRNVRTDEALEIVSLTPGNYQLVLAKANTGPANLLKYIYFTFPNGVEGEYLPGAPSTYGHSAARGGQSVAATFYVTPDVPEIFTSLGPTTIYFDRQGNRLAAPEVRQVPQITAVDNTNTTFFGSVDIEGDGFLNFPGTSAAAPHAAAIGALVLQAAGSPATFNPTDLHTALQNTAVDVPFDTDPDFSKVVVGPLTVSTKGDGSNSSSQDPNFFTITLDPSAVGERVVQVVIDLSTAGLGLVFDTSSLEEGGFPFTLGTLRGVTADQVDWELNDSSTLLTLTFDSDSFGPGDSVSFGIDWDVAASENGGNDADLLAGATVSAMGRSGAAGSGVFVNTSSSGFDPLTGFGLVNALGAVNAVP
ncbi:MAG: S8 family serine peptidase [Gemmatimonadaceae bacterium]|nr:S8 family serine peptidase [Gloeobacterales cyanobacterium ES-bin-141]